MKTIDLRSDTVTRPTEPMRRAMAAAEVGDDVYGEDPTVRRLEERTAELLGHAAGLFVPSGTMANQLAIGLQVRPGDEVIAEEGSHCVNFEGGALSALWGAQPRALLGNRGMLEPSQVEDALRPRNDHYPRSRLLCLENTCGKAAGAVWPLAKLSQVVSLARRAKLSVHLDGARLFNAACAARVAPSDYAGIVDTVSVCFSKGLGAPVGSVLCGSVELMREARRLRKRLGGGMRQAGVLAAAALYALDHHVARLEEDHANAALLAQGLSHIPRLRVHPVETNMVFVDFPVPVGEALALLAREGLLGGGAGVGAYTVRLVVHLDVSRAEIDEALAKVRVALGC